MGGEQLGIIELVAEGRREAVTEDLDIPLVETETVSEGTIGADVGDGEGEGEAPHTVIESFIVRHTSSF